MKDRLKAFVTLVTALVSLVTSAIAEPGTRCEQSRIIVGRCLVIRGRMFFPNGTPSVRIWRIGTKRIMGVLDGAKSAESDAVLPAALKARLGPEWDKFDVLGDFEVCPLTHERPGWMQFVCVKDVENAQLRQR